MRNLKRLKGPLFISVVSISTLWAIRSKVHTDEKPKLRDFQSGDAGSYIFGFLKPNDGNEMVKFLSEKKEFTANKTSDAKALVTDIGGGSGEMLQYIVNLLPLAKEISIDVIESNATRLIKYGERAKQFPQVSMNDKLQPFSIQKAQLQSSNSLILASHVLYYNKDQWWENSQISSKFLDQIISKLRPGGAFCVILQSNAATGISKKEGGEIANLENLEDVVHPLIAQTEGKHETNREKPFFANAEIFIEVMNKYERQLNKPSSLMWDVSAPIITQIPVGKVNFDKNPSTGMYEQDFQVTQILNFYSRSRYAPTESDRQNGVKGFSADQQLLFLNFIKKNCQDLAGNYSIVHVNKIIVIIPTSLHQAITQQEPCKEESAHSLKF